jgi:hypothetical protein
VHRPEDEQAFFSLPYVQRRREGGAAVLRSGEVNLQRSGRCETYTDIQYGPMRLQLVSE